MPDAAEPVWTYFTWYVGNPNPPEYGTAEALRVLIR